MHREKNPVYYRGRYSPQHPLRVLESMAMDMGINALVLIPCDLHDDISLAILSFSYLIIFSLSEIICIRLEACHNSPNLTEIPSHDHTSTQPPFHFSAPFHSEIPQKEWCLLISQFLP